MTAKDGKNEAYSVKYKVKDKNTIILLNKDTVGLQLNIDQGKRPEEETWYQVAQYAARGAMLVRNVKFNYSRTNSTYLPSFIPGIGDFMGQRGGDYLSPGMGFAFGFDGGESYVDKARDRGWLLINDSLTTPAVLSQTEDFQYTIGLEPVPGLKITLNGTRVHTQGRQYQFMFDNVPLQRSGNFTMTTIAIRTSLGNPKAENNYKSEAFDKFVKYRQNIAARIDRQYEGALYPNVDGLLADNSTGVANPSVSGSRLNSADVMIPAFFAAYTGKDPEKVHMTAFPSLKYMLPNWRVTYDGLIRIPFLNQYLRSIMLNHAYRCTYSVGSFASYLNWVENLDGLGFLLDPLSGTLVPSSPFDIGSVNITESFSPLLGVDMTFRNGITAQIGRAHV